MELHRNRRVTSRSNSTGTVQPQASSSNALRVIERRRPGGSAVDVILEDDYSDYDFETGPTSPLKRKRSLNQVDCDRIEKRVRLEVTKLADLMECPVCLDFPRSAPIFSCRNGHLICAKCQPKLDCCPICRSPDVSCRNGFAEKFVSTPSKIIILAFSLNLSFIRRKFTFFKSHLASGF